MEGFGITRGRRVFNFSNFAYLERNKPPIILNWPTPTLVTGPELAPSTLVTGPELAHPTPVIGPKLAPSTLVSGAELVPLTLVSGPELMLPPLDM